MFPGTERALGQALLAAAAVVTGCGGEGQLITSDPRPFDAVIAIRDNSGVDFHDVYGLRVDGEPAHLCSRCAAYGVSPDRRHVALSRPESHGVFTLHSADGSQRLFPANALAWSPTSERLAVAGQNRLFLANGDGSRASALPGEGSIGSIRWAPDGQRVAFERGEVTVVSAADGSEAVELPTRRGIVGWAPDSWRLVVISTEGLELCNADGTGYVDLAPKSSGYWGWSADAAWLAFSAGGNELIVVSADGANQTVLAPRGLAAWSPAQPLLVFSDWEAPGANLAFWSAEDSITTAYEGSAGLVYNLDWSPDGSRFVYYTLGRAFESGYTAIVDSGGAELARFDGWADWNATGSWLASGVVDELDSSTSLLVRDAAGEPTPIAERIWRAAWLADGEHLAVIDDRDVWIVRVSDQQATYVLSSGENPAESWWILP